MGRLPRIALGTIQRNVDAQPLAGALVELLLRAGVDTQVFSSQSRFVPIDTAGAVNGKRQRHLDSWLMSPELCRRMFCFGSQGSDLSIVVGECTLAHEDATPGGGTLDALCEWLDLPLIVVLDASQIGHCQLPQLPRHTVGVLLDKVDSDDERVRWQTLLESHTPAAFMGSLPRCPKIRAQLDRCSESGGSPKTLVQRLADQLSGTIKLDALVHAAQRSKFSWADDLDLTPTFGRHDLDVAIAYDEVFNCYFPDTLDALEMQGARLCDFSPLKGDKLPSRCELVLFGCGHPERFADVLMRNICMKQALQTHVRAGRRVYAEGGGLAYICQTMVCGSRRFDMAGLLPAVARFAPQASRAVEFSLARDSWLGPTNTLIRGYRNSCWTLDPSSHLLEFSSDPDYRRNLVGYHQIIGSRLHLHFSANPLMMQNLLRPRRAVKG